MKIKLVYKVLTPIQFSGDMYGDYGYEINGVKSKKSYVSKNGAENAMRREIVKLLETGKYYI